MIPQTLFVNLLPEFDGFQEKEALNELVSTGKSSARMLKCANILLMSDCKKHHDKDIATAFSVGTATIFRTKKRFVEHGLSDALSDGSRSRMPRKLDGNQEALLIALACSKPPMGCIRWTLDLYAKPANPAQPIVNFDEAMKQLVSDIIPPSPAKPGQAARMDNEHKRVSVANIFLFFDRHNGWRKAKATQTKKAEYFAQCIKELVDEHYPDAEKAHVVMDNYGTHKTGSLYKAFEPKEALRILNRFTPKHASFLNMVEIKIGNMNQQRLDRRIPDWDELESELVAWANRRNEAKASINWMFDVDTARQKITCL